MAKLQTVARKVQIEVERFDGGRNTKDAPSRLNSAETPDELNVVYDELGAVETRDGSQILGYAGSAPVDGLASYQGTMVVWAGGDMYRMSGNTAVTIASAQSVFASGLKIACTQYQNILFCSDGNATYRYEGNQSFYQHGIDIPSNCLGSSPAGGINSGTYYYRIAYENSHVVEGEPGTYHVRSHPNTQCTNVLYSIPTGDASHGVSKRVVYRASTSLGPWKYVGEIANNTASTFTDSMSAVTFNAQVRYAIEDGTAPNGYETVKLHQERLFFPDADRSVIRWTEYTNPFISPAANFYPLDKGDGSEIQAIAVQDTLITAFKDNSIWVGILNDPSEDLTWSWVKSPANLGIVGPRAFWEGPGFVVFMARSAADVDKGRIFGLCALSGIDVQDAAYGPLRTKSISEKIEPEVLKFEETLWHDVAMMGYENQIHMACAIEDDLKNDHLYWFDLNRMVSDKGQPGSWALWDGIPVRSWVVHDGKLYGGSSDDDGAVIQLYAGQYEDSGAAIDSYFYTKPLGGETSIDSWIKDFRWLNVWYQQIGDSVWQIYARSEQIYDGSTEAYGGDEEFIGDVTKVESGSLYGSAIYGSSPYYVSPAQIEGRFSLGSMLARRMSFKFSNGRVVGAAFKVLSLKALCNLRRQR